MVFLFSFKKNHSRGKCNLLNYLCNLLANGEWEGRRSSLKYFDLEKNYFTLECFLTLFTLIFPLSVSLLDFHTHCFQLVCGTTLAWLALTLSPFSPLSPFLPEFSISTRSRKRIRQLFYILSGSSWEVLAWCYYAWVLLGYITRLAFRPVAVKKKIRQLFYILSGSSR